MTVQNESKARDQILHQARSLGSGPDQLEKEPASSVLNLVEQLELLLADRTVRLKTAQKELQLQLTERSMVEAQLRAERDKIQHYLDIAEVIIMVIDCDGNISLINKKGCRVLGYDREELVGKNWFDSCLPERYRATSRESFARLMAGHEPFGKSHEKTVRTKDGQERLTFWHNRVLKNDEGQTIALLGSGEDITERRQAEIALARSEKRFETLVESSPNGILIIQDERIIFGNQALLKNFGTGPPASIQALFNMVHPEDRPMIEENYRTLTSGQLVSIDTAFRFYPSPRGRGETDLLWLHCQANILDYDGREAILLNLTDITRTRELERLIKIKNRMSTLGRVAAGISHEIRNPLAGINMYLTALEDILDGLETPDAENLGTAKLIVSKIQAASDKMESIIKRVLDFARPSAPNLRPLDINHHVEKALDLAAPTAGKNGINIERSFTPNLPKCHADPHMIEQVVINLVTNSIEAMKTVAVKKLAISSFLDETGVILKISDSGPGVPEEKRKKIFDPFYTTKKAGSGIGLSLCYRIVTDHGGRLEVGSSQWGGAEFRVEIPFKKRGLFR